jgi:hypothetical protein
MATYVGHCKQQIRPFLIAELAVVFIPVLPPMFSLLAKDVRDTFLVLDSSVDGKAKQCNASYQTKNSEREYRVAAMLRDVLSKVVRDIGLVAVGESRLIGAAFLSNVPPSDTRPELSDAA